MGTTSAAVPVKKASSARYRSVRTRSVSRTSTPSSLAMSMMLSRVMSARQPAASGERRGVEDAVADGEDVLARPVGHIPVGVEQDGLVVAGLDGLGLGQRGVDVLAGGLGGGRGCVRVEATARSESD